MIKSETDFDAESFFFANTKDFIFSGQVWEFNLQVDSLIIFHKELGKKSQANPPEAD